MYFLGFIFAIATTSASAVAVITTPRATSQYIKRDTYNYMYPYMNNQMRTDLNPGVTVSQSTNPMDVVVKTKPLSNSTSARRVVPRGNSGNIARATTNTNTANTRRVIARSGATPTQFASRPSNRQVVNRSSKRSNGATYVNNTQYVNRAPTSLSTPDIITPVSTARCMADYTECMNHYCERADTEYNRCYCSSKLSQIDSQYQPQIQELFTKILTARGTNAWSDAEMNSYWMDTVGKYTGGTNSWETLDDALNIDWAGLESTVRGQNAFTMGHEYCVRHLDNCYYMASNMRDAYRSEISRDCAIYEQSLQNLKTAAESLLEYYND